MSSNDITTSGGDLFVINATGGGYPYTSTIAEYTTSGLTVNANLVSLPGGGAWYGIAVSGTTIFAAYPGLTEGSGLIGEFTTSGATLNASFLSGLDSPLGVAMSGGDLFVANYANGTIGEYTTSGATVNPSLITGLSGLWDLAVVATPEPSASALLAIGAAALLACRPRQPPSVRSCLRHRAC